MTIIELSRRGARRVRPMPRGPEGLWAAMIEAIGPVADDLEDPAAERRELAALRLRPVTAGPADYGV